MPLSSFFSGSLFSTSFVPSGKTLPDEQLHTHGLKSKTRSDLISRFTRQFPRPEPKVTFPRGSSHPTTGGTLHVRATHELSFRNFGRAISHKGVLCRSFSALAGSAMPGRA